MSSAILTPPRPPFPIPAYGTTPHVPGVTSTYTAYVDGRLVNVIAGSMHVENQIGQRSTGGCSVWTPLGTVWNYGTHFTLYDDQGELAYNGYIVKDKAYKSGSPLLAGYLEHDLTLMDNVYKADKRRAKGQYLNQSAGSVVKNLVDTILKQEGVTYTSSSIADGLTIVQIVWNYNKSCSEAIQWLATQCGYWWNIDLNGVLFFQPYTGVPAPFVMDGTMADSMQDLHVEFGNDQYVNSEYAKGSYAEKGSKAAPLSDTFHGNGVTRTFTLSYPMSTLFSMVLNGVDVTVSVLSKGQNGGEFYVATADPIVAQDPSQPVLTSGDTLVVTYAGRYPIVAVAKSAALIAAQKLREGGGSGLVESSYTNTKLRTQAAAFQVASALLSHYGQDTTTLVFSTRTKGLQPGQMLTVQLADYGVPNKQMLISEVDINDQADGINIWFTVTAVGSPVENAQWQTYYAALMQQASDPSDYTDVNDDSALSLVLSTQLNFPTWVGTVTKTQTVCPIFNTGTLAGNSTIFC